MYRITFVCTLLVSSAAYAGPSKTWTQESYRHFKEGKTDGLRITSIGEIKQGWSTKRAEADKVGGIWCSVMDKGSLIVGADEGKVFRISKTGGPKLLAKIPGAIAVTAIAKANSGSYFVGTMPGASVWRVGPSGKPTRLAKLAKVETVWTLGVSKNGRTIFAGGGPQAQLFSINTKSGAAKMIFDAKDKRIMSLTVAADGDVWFGTSDKAIVYKHTPGQKGARAMADFAGNEITAMTNFAGGVAVVANDIKQKAESGVKTKKQINDAKGKDDPGHKPDMPSIGSKPGADKQISSSSEVRRRGAAKGKGALFHIHADGSFEQLHALTATYFTSLAVDQSGTLFAGSAERGRIYAVEKNASSATAFDVGERMIATIAADGSGMAFATYDPEATYHVLGGASGGTYESDVYDAKNIASFGRISWFGNDITIMARSGNTAEPGIGWSNWRPLSGIIKSAGGNSYGKSNVPRGRYFQYKIKATKRGAKLSRLELRVQPQNRATKVTNIEAKAKGLPALAVIKDGPTKPRTRVVKLSWKVKNPDSDKTSYEVFIRREGANGWRRLPRKNGPLTSTSYEWNTEAFEDGYYRAKVVASDAISNPQASSRTHALISRPFAVDNHGPEIGAISVRYPSVAVTTTDALSAIREAAYSIDDGEWKLVGTRDKVFDDVTETLQFRLPKLAPGQHTLTIRVADSEGNMGTSSTTFRR